MTKRFSALLLATMIGLIIVAIALGFLTSMSNPVSWILIVVLAILPWLYRMKSQRRQLVWKDEYSVGVKVLDDDHKKLIELLNQFKVAYDYQTSEEYERASLEALVNYTKFHFNREEDLMEKAGYPGLAEHKLQHQRMIREVDGFVEKYNEQGHEAMSDISDFLSAWLINHINGTDKQYTKYLNDQGVS